MMLSRMSRRSMLKGATALGALMATSNNVFAQAPARSAAGPRAALQVRG